jgi:hypothetical protein
MFYRTDCKILTSGWYWPLYVLLLLTVWEVHMSSLKMILCVLKHFAEITTRDSVVILMALYSFILE